MLSAGAVSRPSSQRQPCSSGKSGPSSLASTCLCGAKARCCGADAALVDVAGRAFRRSWAAHWRRQYVEVLELAVIPKSISPPPRPPRAVRQASPLELAGSAVPQCRVGTTATACHGGFRSPFFGVNLSRRDLCPTNFFYYLPFFPLMDSPGRDPFVS